MVLQSFLNYSGIRGAKDRTWSLGLRVRNYKTITATIPSNSGLSMLVLETVFRKLESPRITPE